MVGVGTAGGICIEMLYLKLISSKFVNDGSLNTQFLGAHSLVNVVDLTQ